jgi:hypothetical protein
VNAASFGRGVLRSKLEAGARSASIDEESNLRFTFADDDGFAVAERAAIDVDGEISSRKSGERARHAALKFIERCALADRFTNRKRQQFANAQRRCERKRRRAGSADGVKVEWHADADHADSFGEFRGAACREGVPLR